MSDYQTPSDQIVFLQLQAMHALGNLDGRLATMGEGVARRFAFTLLRHILIISLEDGGFLDAARSFDRWISGGAPPQNTPQTIAPPEVVSGTVLLEIQGHPWKPLADAALFLIRVAPALTQRGGGDDFIQACEVVHSLIQACAANDSHPLALFVSLITAVAKSPHFAPGIREPVPFDTEMGLKLVTVPAARSALWMVNLQLGHLLKRSHLVRLELPFARAIRPEALRADLDSDERTLAWTRSLGEAVQAQLSLLDRCARAEARAANGLATLRSSSRAPLVHAALAGLGPLYIAQLARGLEASRLGVVGMLEALDRLGLVRQDGKIWRAVEPSETIKPQPKFSDELRETVSSFDHALARLEKLIAKP